MKTKLNIYRIAWYGINLAALYLWIIPTISAPIYTKCVRHHMCSRWLRSSGWPLHYLVDQADGQWRDIRGNLPILWAALLGVSILHFVMRYLTKGDDSPQGRKLAALKSSWFRFIVGIVFLFVLHKWHMYIVLVLSLIAYQLAMNLNGCKGASIVTWGFALLIILLKECYRWQYSINSDIIYWMFDKSQYGGLYAWQFPANFLILRIISYSVDYHHAVRYHATKAVEQTTKNNNTNNTNSVIGTSDTTVQQSTQSMERDESSPDFHRPLDEYTNIIHFLSYILYTPLYMAGPIMSYNSFIYYSHFPNAIKENVLYYGLRWLFSFTIMEYLTSRYPFFAVIQAGLLPYLSISEVVVVAYMTLKLMWLKFLLIWRFFRLWALADGCNPPENMRKCMSNNCSLEEFWRSWHASFNSWLIRYLYVPLGGRSNRLGSIWLVFLFVAIWHDIEMKLIVWGLLNASFYVVEVLGKRFMNTDFVQKNLSSNAIKFVGIFSAATYIIVLVLVNLLGYSLLGTDGTSLILSKLLSREGIQVMVVSYYFLLWGVNLMSYIREVREETDGKGKDVKNGDNSTNDVTLPASNISASDKKKQ